MRIDLGTVDFRDKHTVWSYRKSTQRFGAAFRRQAGMGNTCSSCERGAAEIIDILDDPFSPVSIVSAANVAAEYLERRQAKSPFTPAWLPNKGVGAAMQKAGYRTKHPIACINSMVGSVLECVESEDAPDWVGEKARSPGRPAKRPIQPPPARAWIRRPTSSCDP